MNLKNNQSGMTVLEIVIATALYSTVLFFIFNGIKKTEVSKFDLAQADFKNIGVAVLRFRTDTGRGSNCEMDLNFLLKKPAGTSTWRGPYLDDKQLVDPWGGHYVCEETGGKTYRIRSAGPDSKLGNADDMVQ